MSFLRFLKDRLARVRSHQFNRWQVSAEGLVVTRANGTQFLLPWGDIAEIVAFKRDLFVEDQICVGFRLAQERDCLAIEEDNPDFAAVLEEARVRFHLPQGFHLSVASPPFKQTWTTMWGAPRPEPYDNE